MKPYRHRRFNNADYDGPVNCAVGGFVSREARVSVVILSSVTFFNAFQNNSNEGPIILDWSYAENLIQPRHLAPVDQVILNSTGMESADGTNEVIALGTSNNVSSSVEQHSPPSAVCVGEDRQCIAKTEDKINGLIKKRRHLAVSLLESLSSSNNSPATSLSLPGLSPMKRFSKHHLSVTELCDQSWCEVKVIYGF
ncbi:hypothetical protein UPYG_G00199560 [Umbra pygmaea]|uniref:Uncharacterized protein n=1 Tax=Umbra pygmaea TaxID=75934 RepID=A0ABD0WHX2_UMBPY